MQAGGNFFLHEDITGAKKTYEVGKARESEYGREYEEY